MSMNMNMNPSQDKPRVYWRKNQVYLRFPFTLPVSSSAPDVNQQVQDHLKNINTTALKDTQLQLTPLEHQGTSHEIAAQQTTNNEKLLNGVYLFPLPPPPPGEARLWMTEIAGVFQIEPTATTGTMSEMAAMNPADMPDHTLDIVAQMNKANQDNQSPTPAIPNMFWSGSEDTTHGCPVCPPMPVEELAGQWHTTLPAMPEALRNTTGEGVTVFVLDSLPPQQQIQQAAQGAGNNNLLLQSLVENGVFNYDFLSDDEAANPQQMVTTGKDINGNLVGFPMPDHGMFVAGIIHDLAPTAKIECIRVLNNYGVGELATVFDALNRIHARMYSNGDLYQKPVVINLSLLVMAPENDVPPGFTDDISQSTRYQLSQLLKSLMEEGAVIVASVGNDSDPRDTMMNPNGIRYMPRYPARFAYDEQYTLPDIIPVGAVNGQGQDSSFSNYPGTLGVATYGGEIPTVISQGNTDGAQVAMPPDALRGVYTSPVYPALSQGDPAPLTLPHGFHGKPAPNPYAWAYWSGTSFATPIISALAACALQNQQSLKGSAVREAIIGGAPKIPWTRLIGGETGSTPMVQAVQQAQSVPQIQPTQSTQHAQSA